MRNSIPSFSRMQAAPALCAPSFSLFWPTKGSHRQSHRRCKRVIFCNASNGIHMEGKSKKVLILGGTGRVGGSTAIALAKTCPNLHLVLAGRNREKGTELAVELGPKAEFCQVDIDNAKSLAAAFNGVDLVVYTAGPFQREEKCAVLKTAISTKTAYIDVCDDRDYSCLAKAFHDEAVAAGVPAITTAGIFPGVSNSVILTVMAAELVHVAKTGSAKATPAEPERLQFSYFTTGSGGAGPTILKASFLLLGEEVIVYRKGEEVKVKPFSGVLEVDFGKVVGKKPVYPLNFPEVGSTHEVLGVPSVSANFGTKPDVWNWTMAAIANIAPAKVLEDRKSVETLVEISNPIVRVVDTCTGGLMAIRVDLECTDGQKSVGIYSHKQLSTCVGVATCAFVRAVLEGNTQPGVWFPEQPEAIAVELRKKVLKWAAEGTINFVMNKPPWMVPVEILPKDFVLGTYIQ